MTITVNQGRTMAHVPLKNYNPQVQSKNSMYNDALLLQRINTKILSLDQRDLANKIGTLLEYECSATSGAVNAERPTKFHSVTLPSLTVTKYLIRILNCIPTLDNIVLILILLYATRLKKQSILSIQPLMLHRFIAAVLCITSNYISDCYYSNSYYAKVCGLTCYELNCLESDLLKLLDWKLGYEVEEMENLLKSMKQFDCNV